MFLLLLAGLLSLPEEAFLAASIDGAGPVRQIYLCHLSANGADINRGDNHTINRSLEDHGHHLCPDIGRAGNGNGNIQFLHLHQGSARIPDGVFGGAVFHLSRHHDRQPDHHRQGAGAGHDQAGLTMRNLYTFFKYGFICIWSMFVVAPFLWALSTSFKDFQSVTRGATYIPWLQFEPTLEGWRVLWRTPASGGVDIVEPYFNSIIVTCSASLISILLGTLAAYALSRFTFKAGFIRNNDITFFFISQRIMPPVVLSIPFFIMLGYLGLLDSLVGLIMVYIVLLMPIAVWIMVDFFNKVPREIDETALIDGCNPYQAFFKVVLPNSIPGMIVAGMFCLIFGWTDFFFAFILTFTEVQLLPVRIVALNSSITPWWSLSASALISVAPLIVVAFIVERFLSKGNLSEP